MKRKLITALALLTITTVAMSGCEGNQGKSRRDRDDVTESEQETETEPEETEVSETVTETTEATEKPSEPAPTTEAEPTVPFETEAKAEWEFDLPEEISELDLDKCFLFVCDFDNDGANECFIYDRDESTYLVKVTGDEPKIVFEGDETWFPLVIDEAIPCLARYEETSEPFTVTFSTFTIDTEGFDNQNDYEWTDDGDGETGAGDVLKINGEEVTVDYWKENGGNLWSEVKDEYADIVFAYGKAELFMPLVYLVKTEDMNLFAYEIVSVFGEPTDVVPEGGETPFEFVMDLETFESVFTDIYDFDITDYEPGFAPDELPEETGVWYDREAGLVYALNASDAAFNVEYLGIERADDGMIILHYSFITENNAEEFVDAMVMEADNSAGCQFRYFGIY